MAYVIKPLEGLHFGTPKFPNCVVAAYDTGGVGELVLVGTAPLGSIEYDALTVVWGPDDMTTAGDLGPFVNTLPGPVNAAIQQLPDWQQATSFPNPLHDPGVPGTAPTSVPNVNVALRQYFAIAGGVMTVHTYP